MDHIIECPKHNGRFDYRTGEAKRAPVCVNLQDLRDEGRRRPRPRADRVSGSGTAGRPSRHARRQGPAADDDALRGDGRGGGGSRRCRGRHPVERRPGLDPRDAGGSRRLFRAGGPPLRRARDVRGLPARRPPRDPRRRGQRLLLGLAGHDPQPRGGGPPGGRPRGPRSRKSTWTGGFSAVGKTGRRAR